MHILWKKNSFAVALLFLFFIPMLCSAAAADLDDPDISGKKTDLQKTLGSISRGAGYEINKDKISVEQIVGTAIQALLSLLGTIFLGLVVYGGFVWMQAKGDENEIKRAQGMIKNGIIGMAIIMFAYAIAYFVIIRLESATILANP